MPSVGDEIEIGADGSPKREKASAAGVPVWRVVATMRDTRRYAQDPAGIVYGYNGRYWEEITEATLKALAYAAWTAHSPKTPTDHTLNNAVHLLKVQVHNAELTFGRCADYEVACETGVVDVRTGRVREHLAEDWLESVLPVAYDPNADCPLWTRCLADWLQDDTERWDALAQFFGYIVLPRANFKRALCLVGRGDSGKSQIAHVARKLVGERFCSRLSVEHMDDPRYLAALKGKKLNVITELTAEALLADGGFKTLVSVEEPVFLDRKYKEVESYTPLCKHLIACNNLPRLKGRPQEVFRRLLLVPLDHVIPEDEQDPTLIDKLERELPGILNWAISGAKELLERDGQFINVTAAERVLIDWQRTQDPFGDWFDENVEQARDWRLPLATIAKAYNETRPAKRITTRSVGHKLRELGHRDSIATARPATQNKTSGEWQYEKRVVACLIGWRLSWTRAEDLTDTDFDTKDSLVKKGDDFVIG